MSSESTFPKNFSSPTSELNSRPVILSVDDEPAVLYTRYKLLAAAG